MARYKQIDRNPRLPPVVLSEQVQPGSFEFALDHVIDHELVLSALDARLRKDETGASAYDPRVMLKIVLRSGCLGCGMNPALATVSRSSRNAVAFLRRQMPPHCIDGF